VLVVLLVRGCRDDAGEARALMLGGGLRAAAAVDARITDGAWQSCSYVAVTGTFECAGLATAYDATARLLNDARPSWGFLTPAIVAFAATSDVEIRIRLHARLSGMYDTAVSEGSVELACEGDPTRTIERRRILYGDRGDRAIEIRSKLPMRSWSFAFVRDDTLAPPRPFLDGPPDTPPASVRAIR